MEGMGGAMEVAAGRAQAPMAQQELDPPQIHPRFEEMRRETVPERISTLLILRRSSAFATITIPSAVRPSKSSGGYDGRLWRVWSLNSRMVLSWRFPRGCSIHSHAAMCRMRQRHG